MFVSKAKIDLCQALDALLRDAGAKAGESFTGLGVIISSLSAGLPIFPIGPKLEIDPTVEPAALLGAISVPNNPYHDGFHILSPALKLQAISQYFSPPVIADAKVNRAQPFGGRYLAALFGSGLPDVLATGIATPTLGVIIFVDGGEVSRHAL